MEDKNIDDARLTYQILRVSISKMVNDIINQSLKNIKTDAIIAERK